MHMKQHILAALRESYEGWEELLAGLNDAQIAAPLVPAQWTIKDIMAHLMAWQQRSIARFDAAQLNREPIFPQWGTSFDPDSDVDDTDKTNAWIHKTYRDQPWSTILQSWRNEFQHLLQSAETFSEKDLLDSEPYPWLDGHPLAMILLATYDHHQEHFEKLVAWLQTHADLKTTGPGI